MNKDQGLEKVSNKIQGKADTPIGRGADNVMDGVKNAGHSIADGARSTTEKTGNMLQGKGFVADTPMERAADSVQDGADSVKAAFTKDWSFQLQPRVISKTHK